MMNVVLITVDCLRADHLGCMSYHRDTSPFLDELSKKSMFFNQAFSNGPNTRHSVPSFLSSTYPLLFLDESKGGKFHPGRKSIAAVLQQKGFHTGCVHSNPYVSAFYGYNRGFGYFNDFLLGQVEDDKKTHPVSKKINEGMKGAKAVFFHQLPHETGEQINETVFHWLDSVDSPFFLWVHYMDVHMPYVPPNTYLKMMNIRPYSHMKKVWMGKKIDDVKTREEIKDDEIKDYINLYDGTIRYTDDLLKNLITTMEKIFPDTLFIITADHGEEFREHNGLSHLEKLYDELLHVPLFFYGHSIKPEKIDKPISLLNLAPSILEYLGFDEEKMFQGTTIDNADGWVISEAMGSEHLTSYRDYEWKMIWSNNKKELYYLPDDPKERTNLYSHKKNEKNIQTMEMKIQLHLQNLLKERKKRQNSIQKQKIKRAALRLKKK